MTSADHKQPCQQESPKGFPGYDPQRGSPTAGRLSQEVHSASCLLEKLDATSPPDRAVTAAVSTYRPMCKLTHQQQQNSSSPSSGNNLPTKKTSCLHVCYRS